MKVCPICASTYGDRVDFCFQDGAPLTIAEAAPEPRAAPVLPPVVPTFDPTALPDSPLETAPRARLPIETGDEVAPDAPTEEMLEAATPLDVASEESALSSAPTLVREVSAPAPEGRQTLPPRPPKSPESMAPPEPPAPEPPPADVSSGVQLGADAMDEEQDDEAFAPPPDSARGQAVAAMVAIAVLIAVGGLWLMGQVGGDAPVEPPSTPEVPVAAPVDAEMTDAAQEPAPEAVDEPVAVDEAPPSEGEAGAEDATGDDAQADSAAAVAVPAETPSPAPAPAASPAPPPPPPPPRPPARPVRSTGSTGAPSAGAPSAAQTPASPWAGGGGAAPAPEAVKARLSIVTSPAGAQIKVDGRSVGASPWSGEVARGRHSVRAELAGHKSAARSIDVTTGQLDLSFNLRPAVVTGQVNIYGTPQASVFIDGNPVGEIPVTAVLSEGAHRFEVRTLDGQSFTRKYDIKFSQPGVPVTITLIAQ